MLFLDNCECWLVPEANSEPKNHLKSMRKQFLLLLIETCTISTLFGSKAS